MKFIDIVFDGPPGPEAGRFVEVEDESGKSIRFGEWVQRPDKYWALRINQAMTPDIEALLKEADDYVQRGYYTSPERYAAALREQARIIKGLHDSGHEGAQLAIQEMTALRAALATQAATIEGLKSRAIVDVIGERQRQVGEEGWTAEHDDAHQRGILAQAAACYAVHASDFAAAGYGSAPYWPFDEEWFKPKDIRRDLVRAAALILAEIERFDREDAALEREGNQLDARKYDDELSHALWLPKGVDDENSDH